jgi:hypothetical protein
LPVRKSVLDGDVSPLDETSFVQALTKRGQKLRALIAREECNHRHLGLLRPRRERPCRRAPEPRDELPAPH